jgi:hypothetical protein
VIAVGATAALGNLGALRSTTRPGASNPGTSAACGPGDLRASAPLQGAAGSVVGAIVVTNTSARPCTLRGRPVVRVFTASSTELHVQVHDVAPQWQADASPRPAGWPVVRLRPGASAGVRLSWSNACPQLTAQARFHVDVGEGTIVTGPTFPPPCNGPTEPSTLEVGPFEPTTSSS